MERRSKYFASEANIPRMIAAERERRGLSYEALARLMTEAGCPIPKSAIFRIEKGDPPRRVTVEELLAFADVLNLDVRDLLTPAGPLQQQRAKELIAELEAAASNFVAAVQRLVTGYADWAQLTQSNEELNEYIVNHLKRADFWHTLTARIAERITINGLGTESVEQALWTIQAAAQHRAHIETTEGIDGEH